ncbi:unnamed protein product [Prorocentrum cordatum]|uniref:Uncharacterized protein n=1 Tax=Prorocentrum cordatum TaxID=2364126 RepID=A0ABN9XDP3_9DINO|nr:unnamed protein product [Polarella glacialis]
MGRLGAASGPLSGQAFTKSGEGGFLSQVGPSVVIDSIVARGIVIKMVRESVPLATHRKVAKAHEDGPDALDLAALEAAARGQAAVLAHWAPGEAAAPLPLAPRPPERPGKRPGPLAEDVFVHLRVNGADRTAYFEEGRLALRRAGLGEVEPVHVASGRGPAAAARQRRAPAAVRPRRAAIARGVGGAGLAPRPPAAPPPHHLLTGDSPSGPSAGAARGRGKGGAAGKGLASSPGDGPGHGAPAGPRPGRGRGALAAPVPRRPHAAAAFNGAAAKGGCGRGPGQGQGPLGVSMLLPIVEAKLREMRERCKAAAFPGAGHWRQIQWSGEQFTTHEVKDATLARAVTRGPLRFAVFAEAGWFGLGQALRSAAQWRRDAGGDGGEGRAEQRSETDRV